MVGHIDQPRLRIVEDSVRILASRSFFEELVAGEIENPNCVIPSVAGEREFQFRYERDAVNTRKLADGGDTAAGTRVRPREPLLQPCHPKADRARSRFLPSQSAT